MASVLILQLICKAIYIDGYRKYVVMNFRWVQKSLDGQEIADRYTVIWFAQKLKSDGMEYSNFLFRNGKKNAFSVHCLKMSHFPNNLFIPYPPGYSCWKRQILFFL